MSLTTLAGLKASIASWMKRNDLTADVGDLITLAEARHAREIRTAQQLTITTVPVAISGTTATLPADFLEAKAIGFQSFDSPLDVASLEKVFDARRAYAASIPAGTRPTVYSIQGLTIHVGPTSDAEYTLALAYYARYAALAGEADTNWLLTNHPGVYLWAALAEAAVFSVEDERMGLFETKYAAEKLTLEDAQRRAQFSGASLQFSTIGTQAIV